MDKYSYNSLLSPAERKQCMALGALAKCAEEGVHSSDAIFDKLQPFFSTGDITKEAQLADIADTGLQALLLTSLVTGVPLGVAAHYLGKATTRDNKETRATKQEIQHYRDAAKDLDAEMRIQNL